jgi:hypothetical protein
MYGSDPKLFDQSYVTPCKSILCSWNGLNRFWHGFTSNAHNFGFCFTTHTQSSKIHPKLRRLNDIGTEFPGPKCKRNQNGAVSKVNKKFISHLTRAQHTPSAAATVQVSQAPPAVYFSCLLRGRTASLQDCVTAVKGFVCLPFWGAQICDYSAACP